MTTMKAYVRDRYCEPAELELRELPVPPAPEAGVLVRVGAVSLNRGDFYMVRGIPRLLRLSAGIRRPSEVRVGWDFAGTVEAVGPREPELRIGDDVFGQANGSFGEYLTVTDGVARKPSNLSLDDAAALPVAGITALDGLRRAHLTDGVRVLVNGASGGVGTFAVQIASAFGADVTAVCSTRNVEQALALGARRVVDYTCADFTRDGETWDVIYDVAGNRHWHDLRRALPRGGVLVQAGAPKKHPLAHIAATRLASIGSGRRIVNFVARATRADLRALAELVEAGALAPVVERLVPFEELPQALAYLGAGHARGKVVVAV